MTSPDSPIETSTASQTQDERFLRAFRRSLMLKTSMSVFVMGVAVALISIWPLYSLLKEHELDGLQLTAATRQMTVEEYLSKAREAAILITSRSQMREDLEGYNEARLSLEDLIERTRPKMLDAISASQFVVGVSRFSATGEFVFETGISIPEQYHFLPGESDPRALMRGPFRIAGALYVVVGTSIVNREGRRVGTDVILISTETLSQFVADPSSLGKTGRVLVGRIRNGVTETFFTSGDPPSTTEGGEPSSDQVMLRRLFTRADADGQAGAQFSKLAGQACVAVHFAEIDWTLVITKEMSELSAPLRRQLGLISALIIGLMLLGVVTMVWALRPLQGMVVEHSDRLREQLDLTERALQKGTAAERALSRERERLEVTLHSISDAVIATDNQASVTMLNRAAEDLLGVTSQEAQGCSFLHVAPLHASPEAPAIDLAAQVLSAVSIVDLSVPQVLMTRGGRQLRVHASGAPILDDHDQQRGAVMVITDVTKRHELELQLRQAQKLEAIGQLTGGIAHDFNNILTAILGHGEMALDGMSAEDEQRENVEAMHSAGQRAAALTRQLLAFSRKQTLNVRPIDLNEVVGGLVEMLRRLLPEKVDFKFMPSPQPATLLADSGQVEQVMLNMVVNARDAMPRGGTLRIQISEAQLDAKFAEFHPKATSGPYVLVRVSDTGAGMPPPVIDRIFEPFYTTKAVGKGTGLGLSTSLGIIEQHGGHVDIESEVGVGTTFSIYLPATDEPAVSSNAVNAGEMVPGTGTILVVDDDAVILNLLCKVLRGLGYRVLAALNGQAALEFAEGLPGPLDLLLTDVSMPIIDGPSLSAKLRETRPHLPVIYMSGHTQEKPLEGSSEELEHDALFLSKPVLPSLLSASIQQLLGRPMPESRENDGKSSGPVS